MVGGPQGSGVCMRTVLPEPLPVCIPRWVVLYQQHTSSNRSPCWAGHDSPLASGTSSGHRITGARAGPRLVGRLRCARRPGLTPELTLLSSTRGQMVAPVAWGVDPAGLSFHPGSESEQPGSLGNRNTNMHKEWKEGPSSFGVLSAPPRCDLPFCTRWAGRCPQHEAGALLCSAPPESSHS